MRVTINFPFISAIYVNSSPLYNCLITHTYDDVFLHSELQLVYTYINTADFSILPYELKKKLKKFGDKFKVPIFTQLLQRSNNISILCQYNQISLLKLLYAHGVNINNTACYAAKYNKMEIIKWAFPLFYNNTYDMYNYAAEYNRIDIINYLIAYGAPIPLNAIDIAASVSLDLVKLLHSVKFAHLGELEIANIIDESIAIDKATALNDDVVINWLIANNYPIHKSTIVQAALNGNYKMVKQIYTRLIAQDSDYRDIIFRDVHLIKTIVKYNAPLIDWVVDKVMTLEGRNAVMCAVGDIETIKFLYNINYEISYDAIAAAVVNDNIDIFNYLRSFGTHALNECPTDVLRNALNKCVLKNNIYMVKLLIEHGVNYDHVAVDNAALIGDLDLFKYLIEAKNVMCTDVAMSNAAKNNHLHILQWAHDTNINQWSTDIMDCAASNGNIDIVKWLLINNKPWLPYALICAASYGHMDIINIMRNARCINKMEITRALTSAAYNGHLHVIKCLMTKPTSQLLYRLLHQASIKGHLYIMKWLRAHTNYNHTSAHTNVIRKCAINNKYYSILQWVNICGA